MQLISKNCLAVHITMDFKNKLIVTQRRVYRQKLSLIFWIKDFLNQVKSQHECVLFNSIFLFKLKIGNYRILILGFVLDRKIKLLIGKYIFNLATCDIRVLCSANKLATQIVARGLLITLNHFIKLVELVIDPIAVLVCDERLTQ